ncbi:MAG: ATP-dependent zinc metalloprotease FtsH [Planctomycetes bacterium]|nr:ATP-dependent zinc metalloprotease FtsH [Planctomycetota bacterium]
MFDDDDRKPNKNDRREPDEERRDDDKGDPKGVGFKSSKVLFLVIFIGILVAIVFGSTSISLNGRVDEVPDWTSFVKRVESGDVTKIKFVNRDVFGVYRSGSEYTKKGDKLHIVAPDPLGDYWQKWLHEQAQKNPQIEIDFQKPPEWPAYVIGLLPWLLLFFLVYFFVFRQLRGPGGPGGVLSFGRSKATLITKDKTKKTFKDVAGIDEAKQEVEEIVGFLKNPKKFQRLGGRIPKGILLIGSPGTGKTLLAKAIAGEADVPFYSISGSDFVEMFVGVGASRVRDLFQQARENSPCIIFLDEIDAVGRRRGTGLGGGHDEREQTLNEILVQMDGMESDDKIIVMAATNRPDVLDPALLRPGRFDRHVYVDLPDIKGRDQILRVHSKRVKLSPGVDLNLLAKATPMFSGADLENIINEAALIAVMKDKDGIDNDDLEEARDKVKWGREKKSRVMDEADRWVTAYHEAGHALLGYYGTHVDKPHKVTIMPRGPSLGATHFLPSKDIYNRTRKELLGQIVVAFGGRIAEEMFVGDISTGAKGDIDQVTEIARKMVCEWGMSDRLGPIKYQEDEETIFLGREISRTQAISPSTLIAIDEEVRRIVDECYSEARKVLEGHREAIELVAKALMEYEVISGEELEKVLKEKKLPDRAPVKQVTFRPLPKPEEQAKRAEEGNFAGGNLPGSMPTPAPA